MAKILSTISKIILISVALAAVSGCNTGIESTKTVTMTESDRKALRLSAEDVFMDSIVPAPMKEWRKGKRFLVTDNRVSVIFDSSSASVIAGDSLKGTTLIYDGVTSRRNPDGREECEIIFLYGGRQLLYPTGMTHYDAMDKISGLDVPLMIDLDLVDESRMLLKGKKLWTRSSLWYDADGEKTDGLKFVPVTVTGVEPGNMVFPLRVSLADGSGKESYMYMNIATRQHGVTKESRPFQSLFTLSDPKLLHPNIAPEVWELICAGKVREGMTKEECKLSVGNPPEVTSGQDWNSILDIWEYPDGTFLSFKDGLLVNFRR